MLKLTCCPSFTIYSFIFFITMIDLAVYVTTLIVSFTGSYQGLNNDQFLGPDVMVLDLFGADNPKKIYCDFQVQRFLSPVLLHASFMHIFVSAPIPHSS